MTEPFTTEQIRYLDVYYRQPPPVLNGPKRFLGAVTLDVAPAVSAWSAAGVVRNSAAGLLSSSKGTAYQLLRTNAAATDVEWSALGTSSITPGAANSVLTTDGAGTAVAWLAPLDVAHGGTGAATFTANGVLLGNTTSAVQATAAGIANQVFRIPGAGGAPAFGKIDLSQAAAVTGELTVTNGGTGRSTFISNGIVYGNSTGVLQNTAAGDDNRVLAGTGGLPAFQQIDSANFFSAGAEVTQALPGVVKSAGQLLGTNTNDAAAAGYVGEYTQQSTLYASRFAITSATGTNVPANPIVLTAGDWDISAIIAYDPAATTSITRILGSISTTSATISASSTYWVPNTNEIVVGWSQAAAVPGGLQSGIVFPTYRVTVANGATLTLYLVAYFVFSVSTCKVWGSYWARRVR